MSGDDYSSSLEDYQVYDPDEDDCVCAEIPCCDADCDCGCHGHKW